MKEKITLPTGNKFLPNTRKSYLEKIQKKEKDPKAALRLLTYIRRKEGCSIRHQKLKMCS